MVSAFKSTGEFEVLTELKYRTTDQYLRRGDILVKSGHTVIALQDGECAHEKKVTVEVTVLKKKAKSDAVRALQSILNTRGFNCGEVDGSFGSKTDAAVRAFQEAKGLAVDGSVGAATWTALLNG
jgi:murein L,D-transpeptidase YcbB/YkuD